MFKQIDLYLKWVKVFERSGVTHKLLKITLELWNFLNSYKVPEEDLKNKAKEKYKCFFKKKLKKLETIFKKYLKITERKPTN